MNVYQMLGQSIAESAAAVGAAFRAFPSSAEAALDEAHQAVGWLDQFSAASLDQRAERRTVDALFRGATVRI